LWILVGIVGGALALVVAGMAFHWFDADFGKTLIQTVVSPVLGALAAVVGYLFAAEHRDSG
jgi:phosphate/sulfate permease